jgi:hypothetical protein
MTPTAACARGGLRPAVGRPEPVVVGGQGEQTPQPGPVVPALAVDALDDLPDAPALPRVEHLGEQRAPVVEVPVEAPLGDAERLATSRSLPRR